MTKDLARSARATEQWAKKRRERNSKWTMDSNNIVHIAMTRGLEAIIDSPDRGKAAGYTWTPRFSHKRKGDGFVVYYAEAKIPGSAKTIFLHNLLMDHPPEGMGVDHIDRDGLNCTRNNMRYCTPNQNASNRVHIRKVRPFRGVYRASDCSSWIAKVMVHGKYIYRCGMKSAREAAIAYNELAVEHLREFATLNVIAETE